MVLVMVLLYDMMFYLLNCMRQKKIRFPDLQATTDNSTQPN